MDQRKRLFYVLTCFAGAMASTASLLAWMDPQQRGPTDATAQRSVLGIARSLVSDDVPIRPAMWRRVEVVPEPVAATPGFLLASQPVDAQYHFFIDDRGSLSRAGNWCGQLPVTEDHETVRVRLARPPAANAITDRQTQTLSALLRALDEMVSPSPNSLPVELDPSFASGFAESAASELRTALLARVTG